MSGAQIVFTVPGTPVGKGRPRFAKRGNFVQTYTPEKTASYENLVRLSASSAMKGREPCKSALRCAILLRVVPPASWPKKKRADAVLGLIRPTSKPDLDNVVKGIFDAMNEVVFDDDKQIVELSVRKEYANVAEAVVIVGEVGA